MHKNTKLLPYQRREAYRRWIDGDSVADLCRKYQVARQAMYRTLAKARLGIFVNLPSTNHRYRRVAYGLKHLSRTERALGKKLARREHRLNRYEKASPGELVHFDTKKLPVLMGEALSDPREWLHVAVDDFSRWLVADLLPDKTSYTSAIFLEETISVLPFPMECVYSDNGSEYRGRADHPFVALLLRRKIDQKFTKPRHPYTNGKAERVIKTIMHECFARRSFASRNERRRFLYAFVRWYNEVRPHESLGDTAPLERLRSYLARIRSTTKIVTTR